MINSNQNKPKRTKTTSKTEIFFSSRKLKKQSDLVKKLLPEASFFKFIEFGILISAEALFNTEVNTIIITKTSLILTIIFPC